MRQPDKHERTFTLYAWKGTVKDGWLPNGLYKIKISVRDGNGKTGNDKIGDNNEVNEVYPTINNDSIAANDTIRYLMIDWEGAPYDVVYMVQRSSYATSNYADAVREYVRMMAEKVPNGSGVAVLEFQEQTYPKMAGLVPVGLNGAHDPGRKAVEDSLTAFKRKDTWGLDIGEAAGGQQGDIAWHSDWPYKDDSGFTHKLSDTVTTADARDYLARGSNVRKVGVFVSDWYDSLVQGNSHGGEVRRKWTGYLKDFVGGNNARDLQNIVITGGSAGATAVPSADAYFSWLNFPTEGSCPGSTSPGSCETADNAAAKQGFIDAIGLADVTFMQWDGKKFINTVGLSNLVGCRENLLNEVYQVNPRDRVRLALNVDQSVRDVGLLLFGAGLTHRLYRPDGSLVPVQESAGVLDSQDPSVSFYHFEDGRTERFGLSAPEPGTWIVEIDGSGLAAPALGRAVAFGETSTKFKAFPPGVVRPGELFTLGAAVSDGGELDGTSSVTLRFIRPGSVYAVGSKVYDTELPGTALASGLTSFSEELAIRDYEGRYPYRLLMKGTDVAGNEVYREASGDLFIKGDEPVFAAPDPVEEIVEESPSISVLVADDVAVQNYSMRVDGRQVSTVAEDVVPATVSSRFTAPSADWQPRQVKRITGTVSWVLSPGEHSVEVTATDTIAQEAAPEIWTFRVGGGLLATDAAGDDYGPGYYTYPTDPALMPRGALDLEGFRVYRDGSLISFNVDLKNYYESYAPPTIATLPSVVDVYLDTDGLSGSGRTDLLPGRNALLRPQDAWEYCLSISREGARLIPASGSETPLAATINSGTGTISVILENAQLGVSDPRVLDGWGYLVATLGYDGMNSGHVKEVTTLGGAHVFGGGAEGTWDPSILDLLAGGTAQQAMLGSYSVPQGRLAELTAYRFTNPTPIDDHRAPVLAALAPTGVVATNPPEIGFTASDDWALDLGQMQLWVDGSQIASGALAVTGNVRLASVRYLPGAALAVGRHELRAQAQDQAGNSTEATWEFVVGASAHIAKVGGAARTEGMALRGSVPVAGTVAGGTSWRLEQSADGVAWMPIADGTTDVPAGLLGSWTTSTVTDGAYIVQLTLAGEGWELSDAVAVQVDNTVPDAGLVSVGGAATHGLRKGAAEVLGWAADEHLSTWTLSYGAGETPTSWTALASGSTAAGSADLPASLASLNTAALADALWALRLVARDAAGNERDSRFVIESDNTEPEALIDAPAVGANVPAGTRVSVLGTAYDHHLASWRLEYGAGAAPSTWLSIAGGTSLANHSALGTWDTTGLPPGDYALLLTVTDDVQSVATVQRGVSVSAAPLSRIAGVGPLTPPSPPGGGEGGYLSGAVEVQGTASFLAGGGYIVEASANGTDWTQIASGTMPVTDGVLASWATGAAGDGAYTVRLVVTDADDTTASDQISVLVDNTAPVASISAPAEGAGIGGKVEITGTAADANLSSYTVEWGAGAAPSDWTGLGSFSPASIDGGLLAIWETKGLEVGTYTLRLRAGDQAGSVTELLRQVNITTDSIAPVVALAAPADGTVTSAAGVEVSGSVSDTALTSWELTARQFVDGTWGVAQMLASGTAGASGLLHAWDVSALEGRYRLTLTGLDAAGNAASAAVEVIFVHGAGYAAIEGVGTLPMPFETPLPPFAKGGIGEFVSGPVEVRGTAVAPSLTSYVLEASPDGELWADVATGTTSVTHGVLGFWDTSALGDGDYHLRLRVLDAAVAEVSDTALVPLDNLPPTVAITAPTDGGLIGGYQYILGTAADAHFASYELHVAAAATPDLWRPIGARSFPVTAGNLGTWVVNGDVGPFKQLFAVPGSSDLLSFVQDLETAADGRIFAIDNPAANLIRVFSHQGDFLYSIGESGSSAGQLNYPTGFFIRGDELFVANQHNNNVLIFSLDGDLKATVPLSGIADDAPYDVAVAADGLIYVTCSVTPALKVYTRSGELVRTLSPTIENQQSRYRAIDIDEAGNLYVAAPVLGKLVKLSPTGEYLQSFGPENLVGASLSPNIGGAQVDRAGNVYLVDGSYGIVYQLDAAGTWIGAVGPFYLPDCIKVDDDGMLYVGMPFKVGFVALAPSTPVEAAALPEGSYRLRLRATDKAGHGAETQIEVAVERTPPVAEIAAPVAGAAVAGEVAISGRATDAHFARYELWRATPKQVRDPVTLSWSETLADQTLIGTAQTTAVESGPLGTWDTAGLASGSYVLLLRVYDAAGNLSEARTDVSVGLSAETVAVALTAPAENAALVAGAAVAVQGSIAITGGVLDHYEIGYGQGTAPQGWVEISRGYTAPGSAALSTWDTTGLVQGDYTLLVRAISMSGREAEARVPVRVSAAPVVAVMSPAQGVAVAGVVEILGTVWDEDLTGYTLDRGAGASPTTWEQVASSSLPVVAGVIFRWDTAGLDGEYSFRLRATDAAGNQSTLVRQVAADNTPPVASLSAEIYNFYSGTYSGHELLRTDQFSLRGSATDDHLKSWRIEYGEGAVPTSFETLAASASMSVTDGIFVPAYDAALRGSVAAFGIVTYQLTVEDRAGNISRALVTLRIVDQQEFAAGLVSSPAAVAVSPQGRLYVLDGASFQITTLDAATGDFVGRFGGSGTGNGLFSSAVDVATDPAGNVYVLEWAGRLQKFDPDGVFLAGLPIRGTGLTIGEDGTLYVTGKPAGEQYHVRIHDAAGSLLRAFGVDGSGPGLFDGHSSYSQKIARDRFGYLYVSNGDRGAEVFDSEGRFVTEVQFRPGWNGHRYARGIGLDGNGNLALTLGYQRAVWKTRLDGNLLWYTNIYPESPDDLEVSPWGIFVCGTRLWRFNEPQIDVVPELPQLRIESPAVGAMTNQDYVVVTGTAVAPGFAEYSLAWAPEADPEAFTGIMSSAVPIREGTLGFWRVAGLPNGTYRIRLTLRDDAHGVWTNDSSVTIGRTVPVVAIAAPAAGWHNSATPELAYSVSAGTVVVKLDGQPIAKVSGDTLDLLADGEHRVRVEAVDAAGNIGAAEVVFIVDTVAPTVAISSPAAGVVTISGPALAYAVSDGTVVVKLDGQPIAKVSGDALEPLPDGEHLVRVEATDAAGNLGAAEVLFAVDTAPPVVPGEKTLTLSVATDGGTPIVGANAYLFSAAGVYLGVSRVTDAAGQAAFTVADGSYKIRCDYLGYQFWSSEVAVATNTGLALSIPQRNVRITVNGSYAGATQPKQNVPVYLFTEAGSYLNRSASTDAEGNVSFNLPERGYKVRADYRGFQYWSGTLAGTSAAITIPEALAEVAVGRAGAPLPATPVYVFSAAGSYLGLSGTTDAAGRTNFRLPAQGYRFRADYLGTQYFSAQVSLQADQVNAVPISTGGGMVQLSVSNGAAGAVAGAACYLFNGSGTYLNMSRTTDAAGVAGFDLVDGSYKIRVDYLGASYWTEPFTVPGAASLALDLGGGVLRFSVDRGGGTPLVGVSTYLFDAAGTYLGISQLTDATGEAQYAVPAGTYQIRSDYLGYQFWSGEVAVSAEADLALIIPHRQVTVSVLGEYDGSVEPRPDLPVHLFTSEGGYLGRTLTSDAAGQVRFDLPERGYQLRVDVLGFPYWSVPVQGESATITIPEAIAEVAVTRAAQPLAGVPVYLFATTGAYLNLSGSTAVDGTVSFRLPAQAFRFRADNEGAQFFSADVALAAHQVNTVPLSLGGGTFTLTVVDDGGPLAGIPCYLFDAAETYLGSSRVSDAAGAVSFDLPDGGYLIRADYLGYQFWSDPVAVPSLMTDTLNIPRQEVAVTLRREYDGDTRAVENASVYLFAPAGAYLGESRQTDGAGEARFTLPELSFEVRADYLGRAYWTAPFVWSPQELTIAEGLAEVTVTQAGAPLGGVLVSVFDDLETYLGIAQSTAPAGPASFRLPVGGYRFAADVQGSRFSGSGVVAADQITPVELATGGGLFGLTVDDGDGAALGGVPVSVFTAAGAYLGMQQSTDAQGHVSFTLSDGQYLLRADYLGYQFWTPVQSVPAQTSALLAISHSLARVHVTAAGVDVAGAAVYLFSAAGDYLGTSAATDAAGIAEFRLPGREYSFRADYDGGQHWSSLVTVSEGSVIPVEIALGQ